MNITQASRPVPVWLQEVPTSVLLNDEALDRWLDVLRLPRPSASVLLTERQHRAFLALRGGRR